MRAKIILAVLILSILAVVLGWLVYKNRSSVLKSGAQSSGESPESVIANSAPSGRIPTPSDYFPKTATIGISTNQGIVETNNFYRQAIDTEEGLVILRKNENYELSYDRSSSQFNIYLFSGNVSSQNRVLAENDLLNILGITQSGACKLDLSVFSPDKTVVKAWSFCLP